MSEPITVTGMVLSAADSSEYDKRLVILTRERGKITAFAHGVRRKGNPMMAAANSFVFGSFVVYEGRSAYNLVQANVKEYFTQLAMSFPGVYYGYYFLEFADYYGREGKTERDMLSLLYMAAKALASGRVPQRLIRRVFEVRAMVINGEFPDVFSCAECGIQQKLCRYDPGCGLLCAEHEGASSAAGIAVSSGLVYTLQYIVTAPAEKLFAFTVSEEILRELEMVTARHVSMYVDRRFKSLAILEQML